MKRFTVVALLLVLAPAAFAQHPPLLPRPAATAPAPVEELPLPAPAPTPPAVPAGPVLGLDEAVTIARSHQPSLIQFRAQIGAAEARADESKAALLPQVNFAAGYSRSSVDSVTVTNAAGMTTTSSRSPNSWHLSLSGSQLITDFGQARAHWKAAKASIDLQGKDAKQAELGVVLDVRLAYFNATAAHALERVAQETLANQQHHLEQIQGFVEVGTRPPIDLAQAKAALANAQVAVINQENAYDTARAQLTQAMGGGPPSFEVADQTLPAVAGEDEGTDVLLTRALAARPELAALALQREISDLGVSAARAALYYPTLSASGSVSDVGTNPGNLKLSWTVGLSLNWNLYAGGGDQARLREAEWNRVALNAQTDAQIQNVRLQVEQARLGVRASKAAVVAAAEAVEAAKVQLQLAEGRYQSGVGSVIELGDAQVVVTTAAAQQVQAEFKVSASRAQLLEALGRD